MSDESEQKRRKRSPEAQAADHRTYYGKSSNYDFRSRQPWSQEHEAIILADDRPSDIVLAKKLGRSLKAVQNRRYSLRQADVATGGLNGRLNGTSRRQPATVQIPEPSKPPSLAAVRLRALSMGLKPPAGLSAEAIQEWINRYESAYRAGVVPKAEVELTNQVTVRVLKSGKQRFVSMRDAQAALNRKKAAARRGGR